MKYYDQYGKEVPDDLVLINSVDITDLTLKEIKAIDNADWYEVDGYLCVSYKQYPRDAELVRFYADLEKEEIFFITHILHRYSEDGFYHA